MPELKPVLVYSRYHTTSSIFADTLKHLLTEKAPETDRFHFHVLLDDRRDGETLRRLLPADKVTIHHQYEGMDPYPKKADWTDETVDQWEKRYGNPHLRNYIVMERALEERPERMKWNFLFSHIDYFERLLQQIQPILYISGAADGLSPWVAMTIMKENGIPILSFSPARFGRQSFILNNPFEILQISEAYRTFRREGVPPELKKQAEDLIAGYQDRRLKPLDHLAVRVKQRKRSPFPNPVSAIRLLKESLFTDSGKFDLPVTVAAARALAGRRTGLYKRLLSTKTAHRLPEGEDFFFLPLQYEPEISLATQGRGWTRQRELIKTIALSIPIDRWLYVKEHPSMLMGIRPWNFYREILSLPKVRLLSQSIDSYEIVPLAETVLTITGTAGWEALMHRKPVFLFGHAFYEEFDEGVTRVNNLDDLPRLLRDVRNKRIDDQALTAYVGAVLTKTRPGLFIEPRFYPEQRAEILGNRNLKDIGQIILEYLEGVS